MAIDKKKAVGNKRDAKTAREQLKFSVWYSNPMLDVYLWLLLHPSTVPSHHDLLEARCRMRWVGEMVTGHLNVIFRHAISPRLDWLMLLKL